MPVELPIVDDILYGDICRRRETAFSDQAYCFSGYAGWQGTDRFVAYAESPLDEMIFDTRLPRETEPRQSEKELIESIGPRRSLIVRDVEIGDVDADGLHCCTPLRSKDGETVDPVMIQASEMKLIDDLYRDLLTFWSWSDNLPEYLLLFEQTDLDIIAALKIIRKNPKTR